MSQMAIKNIAQAIRSMGAKDNGSLALAAAIAYALPVLPAGTDFKFTFRRQYESQVASLIGKVNEIQVVDYQATLEQTESLYVKRMQATYSPLVCQECVLTEDYASTGYADVAAAVSNALK